MLIHMKLINHVNNIQWSRICPWGSILMSIKSVLGPLGVPWDNVTSQACREADTSGKHGEWIAKGLMQL